MLNSLPAFKKETVHMFQTTHFINEHVQNVRHPLELTLEVS